MKIYLIALFALLSTSTFGAEIVLKQKAVCTSPAGEEVGIALTHARSARHYTINATVFGQEALSQYLNGATLLKLPSRSGEAYYRPSSFEVIEVNFGQETVRYEQCRELSVWNLFEDWNGLLNAWLY